MEETLKFYRVYHSLRYVGDKLVLRICQRLTDEQVESLSDNFSGLLVEGKIEQVDALPEENNEPELADLPRIKLRFNRKQLGRLRMMIDQINNTCPTCKVSSSC